jgi:hypothetical protein
MLPPPAYIFPCITVQASSHCDHTVGDGDNQLLTFASFLAGGGLAGAGRRAYYVW